VRPKHGCIGGEIETCHAERLSLVKLHGRRLTSGFRFRGLLGVAAAAVFLDFFFVGDRCFGRAALAAGRRCVDTTVRRRAMTAAAGAAVFAARERCLATARAITAASCWRN
jgi:hypothetical protein